jgi:hypothetical protein
MAIPQSFNTNLVLQHTLKDASSAIIRLDGDRPTPEVVVDRKLGEGGYNEVYLISWASLRAIVPVVVDLNSSHNRSQAGMNRQDPSLSLYVFRNQILSCPIKY